MVVKSSSNFHFCQLSAISSFPRARDYYTSFFLSMYCCQAIYIFMIILANWWSLASNLKSDIIMPLYTEIFSIESSMIGEKLSPWLNIWDRNQFLQIVLAKVTKYLYPLHCFVVFVLFYYLFLSFVFFCSCNFHFFCPIF